MTKHKKTFLTELDFDFPSYVDDFTIWNENEIALDVGFSNGILQRLIGELLQTEYFSKKDMDDISICGGDFYLVYNLKENSFSLKCDFEYYYDGTSSDLYGETYIIRLTPKEQNIVNAKVDEFCEKRLAYTGYQNFNDYIQSEGFKDYMPRDKQYAIKEAYTDNYHVLQYQHNVLEKQTIVAYWELSGYIQALKDNGYTEAFFVEEYERDMQKALEEYNAAKEVYMKAKRRPLNLDKTEAAKYKKITFFDDSE